LLTVPSTPSLKLLVDAGKACHAYQDETLRELTCKRLQLDEIWIFCYAKDKNVPEHLQGQDVIASV
jgi:hypothetical protein